MFFWNRKTKKKEEVDFKNTVETLKVKEQLENQVKILFKIGILEFLKDGKTIGIVGLNNKEYNIPTLQEIYNKIQNKLEFIDKKRKEGFTKIVIVPFALPVEKIIKKYEEVLLNHYNDGRLFATKEDESEPDEKLELSIENPINIWSEYRDGDVKNNFVYFPKNHDKKDHGGFTKMDLLSKPENAWQILLLEDMPNIKREGNAKKIEGRKQFETNKTPSEYLKILHTDKTHKGELGLTPEADLIYAITHLEETNQILNDWQGKGSISYELGVFFASSSDVPWSSWNRDFNRVDLWKGNSWNKDPYIGVRVGILI